MKFYIQFRTNARLLETVDEFDSMKEARKMLAEYRMVGGGDHYISTRPCKAWKEES